MDIYFLPEEELNDFLGILRQKGRVFWNREKEIYT